MKPDPFKFALITTDEWQALYVGGKSIAQGHGFHPMELLQLAETYGFTASTLFHRWAAPEDDKQCLEKGNFPPELSQLQATLRDA